VLLGRLQAPKNNIIMINKLNRRVFLFIVSPSLADILPQDDRAYIPRMS
jgi:hypothetical protein